MPLLVRHASLRAVLLWCIAALALRAGGQNLTDDQLQAVEARLADGAQQPWELGTRAQALLEYQATAYSVFSPDSLPPPSSIPSSLTSNLSAIFSIAHNVVANRSASNGGLAATAPQPLVNDSAAGDPPSIGVAVLLANWTGQGAQDGQDYAGAAAGQLLYLFQDVPQTSDGAISHRSGYLQLWSDSVYMVPPFLAYYGVLTGNQSLVQEAYTQIKLYRNYLRDTSANNLWKHIVLGSSGQDPGHWATGNGWAAAGMLRVLATIMRSSYASSMSSEQSDLSNWVQEIHNGIYPHLDSTDIFRNYPDQALSTTNFYDCSSTALLASTVYRLALLKGVYTHIPFAERSRQALSAPANSTNTLPGQSTWASSSSSSSSSSNAASSSSSTSTASGSQDRRHESSERRQRSWDRRQDSSSSSSANGTSSSTSTSSAPTATSPPGPPAPSTSPTSLPGPALAHLTPAGWLSPVVDPYDFGQGGQYSPEGQAFVLEMQAAWRDWVLAGAKGHNAACGVRGTGGVLLGVVVGAVSLYLVV